MPEELLLPCLGPFEGGNVEFFLLEESPGHAGALFECAGRQGVEHPGSLALRCGAMMPTARRSAESPCRCSAALRVFQPELGLVKDFV